MNMQQEGPAQNDTSRGVQVILFVIIAFALVGFFVGIDQGATETYIQRDSSNSDVSIETAAAIPAPAYNAHWKSDYAHITKVDTPLFEEFNPSEQARVLSWASRSEGRAYHGAPPVIPHAADTSSNNNCMSCHADSVRIGSSTANAIPHPYLASCQQCHAPSHNEGFATGFKPPVNTFVGVAAPLAGDTAWEGAPPVIPHSTLMRNNCSACHGQNGDQGIRTPHPWQSSCMQCHVPSAKLDQRPYTSVPELIPSLLTTNPQGDQSTE
jgi:cytochrome c-type protein NapB